MIQEKGLQSELASKMVGEGADSDCFGGIVSGIEDIEAALFRFEIGMMRSFTGQVGINAFCGGSGDVGASTSGQNADTADGLRLD